MRFQSPAVRKFVALFVAAIFVLAVEPSVMAAQPASDHMTMQGMQMAPEGAMGCDHCPPPKHQSVPCKEDGCCPGAAGCFNLVVAGQDGIALSPRDLTNAAVWGSRSAGSGITLRPDHPPPIA